MYTDGESKTKEEKSEEKLEELKKHINSTLTFIDKKLNNDLFTNILKPSAFAKQLYETKDKKKNNILVEEIKDRRSNLKKETKKNV